MDEGHMTDLALTEDQKRCPGCGAQMYEHVEAQPALFKHGGYGETAQRTWLTCDCGTFREIHLESLRPEA